MTDGQFDLRPILAVLVILAVLLAIAQVAVAKPDADRSLTIVSSTTLGDNTFTMTAWNVSLESIDVALPPPGTVAAVTVDMGEFDGLWTIDGLEAGAIGTMIGLIEIE